MKYSPNRDKIYALAIWSTPVIVGLVLILSFSEALLGILVLTILLSLWLWKSTSYEIENGQLFVRSWIFRRRANVGDIAKVRRTRNLLASYALSSDRLEIVEKNNAKYYVSPKDVESFIAELKSLNPDIVVE